ncbi:ATP-dependent endonuclease [filamentous cyanobacterium CCT1]|nr:ATP-dependent endonuclease [filamentous cyanobacterium CCT1]PSN80906.1 ATP-dependent endonuclease [filamentous cyanobacterium CCP4]
MRITKIKVKNFRLLKEITVDLEDDLSVIIGKNNCGKTSFLWILDKFIGNGSSQNTFDSHDFSTEFKDELKFLVEEENNEEAKFQFLGISLKLFIEYEDDDDLSNVGNKVLMDLDLRNKTFVLAFDYYLPEDNFKNLRRDYLRFKSRTHYKENPQSFSIFLKNKHKKYFRISCKSLFYDFESQEVIEDEFVDLKKEGIQIDRIINFKWISARRDVSNKNSDKSLSSLSCKIYKKLEIDDENPAIEDFKNALSVTDESLNEIYNELFKEVISDVRKFGGIKQNESIIKIVSSLQHQDLLAENTTVMYGLESPNHSLPESHNGLGYMNLICMIFEIKILLHEFQKKEAEKPSDINLLFIEEPEVHTHPQMQRIFIQNIKSLLKDVQGLDGNKRNLQTILTTHSSHIVSESKFEDIKYFKRSENSVISKNLKDLEIEYSNNRAYYKFLKQYLTLHRSDLFFADKAIFIEGDTERILLPSMIRKIDQESLLEESPDSNKLLLSSQNVSIIEVGAYSQIFEKFIGFLGIKSLIITDIDSTKNGACPVSEGDQTSNASLKFFYGKDKKLSDFIALSSKEVESRVLKRNCETSNWELNPNGNLLCVFQTEEINSDHKKYHARSFEDAFFHINSHFIKSKSLKEDGAFNEANPFESLTKKHLKIFLKNGDPYKMAENAVTSKPSFAMEILLNSLADDEWNIPKYIKDGLQWLKQN